MLSHQLKKSNTSKLPWSVDVWTLPEQRVTSKGNEAKSQMKHPSDMPTHWDSNSGGSDLWSNTLPVRPQRCPSYFGSDMLVVYGPDKSTYVLKLIWI